MPSSHLSLCHPLLLLPSIFPSIRVFSNESVLRIRWPKYWSFSFSISPSNEYSGPISFRIDRYDLLAVQEIPKSLPAPQFNSSVCSLHYGLTLISIHDYWKNHSSKEQASFNFMAAVAICSDFGAPEKKVCHCFHCFPIYLP